MSYEVVDEPKINRSTIFLIILIIVAIFLIWKWFFYEPVTDDSTEPAGSCYHYSQLNETEQKIYRELYRGCLDYESQINVTPVNMDTCEKVVYAFRYDHPEFFWIMDTITTTSSSSGLVIRVEFSVPADAKSKTGLMEKAADSVLKNIPEKEYDKVKYLYEYIINTTEYDTDAPDHQTAYSALVGKYSVCGGYSAAFLYLCDKAGIYCGYVTGEIVGAEKHAWNFVRLNDKYYWVDTTWGDPSYVNYTKGPEDIFYDYLCVPDSEIMNGRLFSNDEAYSGHKSYMTFEYPSCTDNSLNYYVKKGIYFSSYDRMSVYNAIVTQAVDSSNDIIILKFSSADVLQRAVDDMFEVNSYWIDISDTLESIYGLQYRNKNVTIIGRVNHLVIKVR
ncbi:MAG: hypothetical protein K6E47_07180 [Lachnospiraceae bacterium]|nr:hypothetical protein [Lachnospiraceae bacterium]